MLYCIYASVDKDIYDEYVKFYCVPSNKNHMYKYDPNTDKMHGLYAWTTKKELLEKFLSVREDSEIYTVKKKEDYNNEESDFLTEYFFEYKLGKYSYESSEKDENDVNIIYEIVSPKFEYVSAKIDGKLKVSSHIENIVKKLESIDMTKFLNKDIEDSSRILGLYSFSHLFSKYGMEGEEPYNLIPKKIMSKCDEYSFDVLMYLYRYFFTGYSIL